MLENKDLIDEINKADEFAREEIQARSRFRTLVEQKPMDFETGTIAGTQASMSEINVAATATVVTTADAAMCTCNQKNYSSITQIADKGASACKQWRRGSEPLDCR